MTDDDALGNTAVPGGLATPAPDDGMGATHAPVGGGAVDFGTLQPVDPSNYVLGEEIARGGMGRIFKARDRRLGRPVAIKELLVASGELHVRFEREARITAMLQHPSIVNILEAGQWPSGEPFYAMKLVSGESLDHVVAARPQLTERLALLPNVIAVVDALAYAHSMRVIHRDLKPANVLVGSFGETVVIDWGLAKDLADGSNHADLDLGPMRAGPGQTMVGSVMGTPSYMPLEQARGELVDERADVYALGAILYHVLAGVPPYVGSRAKDVLEAVIAGPPQSIEARAPGIPSDLITIVNKAMARGAADRYPTAQELADDLKKFQTGQLVGAHRYSQWQLLQRWLRRHRTPVTVGAIGVVLLVASAVISVQRVNDQRHVAEKNRDEAEGLMSFMLVDLRDKLQGVGKLELLDVVARKAVAYYSNRTEVDDPLEQAHRAAALSNIGDVLLPRGDLPGAMTQFRAALAVREELVRRAPNDLAAQGELVSSQLKVASVLDAQGDADGAIALFRTAIVGAEGLPVTPENGARLAEAHTGLGNMFLEKKGDLPAALAEFSNAKALRAQLLAADPQNTSLQRDLSRIHNSVGNTLMEQRDLEGALREYRASMAIREALTTIDPGNALWQRDLALSHTKVGNVLVRLGDRAGALAEYQLDLSLRTKLSALDPTNREWRYDHATAQNNVANELAWKGDTEAAMAGFVASFAVVDELSRADPTNVMWLRDRGYVQTQLADMLLKKGDKPGALKTFREALETSERLNARDPNNPRWLRDVSFRRNSVARVLRRQGELAAALAEYRRSIADSTLLLKRDPTYSDWLSDLSFTHTQAGLVLQDQKLFAEAMVEFRLAIELRDALAAKDGAVPRLADQWWAHVNLGNVLVAQGNHAGALDEFRKALVIQEALLSRDPKHRNRRHDLIGNLSRIGDAALAGGDAATALKTYERRRVMRDELNAEDPTNLDWAYDASFAHQDLGNANAALGNVVVAKREYAAALQLRERLVHQLPTNASWKTELEVLRKVAAACCRR